MPNLEICNGIHKGKTCFVLGAGTSLNDLDLSPLKDHITIAVNSGYLAYPESSYFVSDDWAVSRWSYFYDDLKKGSTRPLLYEDKLKEFESCFGDRAILFRHRQGYHITDVYEHEVRANRICQARTSVGTAIHIGHIMGCNPVVLLGVDCYHIAGRRYFWQFWPKEKQPTRNDGIPVDPFVRTSYEGKGTDKDLVDILRYWQRFGKELANKCGVINASEGSMLNTFPKMSLKDVFGRIDALRDSGQTRLV